MISQPCSICSEEERCAVPATPRVIFADPEGNLVWVVSPMQDERDRDINGARLLAGAFFDLSNLGRSLR